MDVRSALARYCFECLVRAWVPRVAGFDMYWFPTVVECRVKAWELEVLREAVVHVCAAFHNTGK